MLKFVVLCAALAVTKAGNLHGAPSIVYSATPAVSHVTYAAAPVAVHAPAIGTSHESTLRSLGGNSAVSHYSKAVDTAFSSVSKYDTRVTNDAKLIATAPAHAYAAVAPAYAYSAPVLARTAYAAPAYTYSAPVVGKPAYAGPAYAYSAPIVSKTAYDAPTYAYGAPIIAKTAYAAPTYAYSAPIVTNAAFTAPASVVAHTTFSGIGASYAW